MTPVLEAVNSIHDVSIQLPGLEEILMVLTLQAGFNSAVVVLGTTFLGIAAGIIGTFSVLRKRALMGDALAHSALPGLGIAYITAFSLGLNARSLPFLLLGATISGVIGVLTVQFLVRYTRLSEDTAIGAVLSVFFGFGIVLLSVIQSLQTGSEGGLHHFIYGQTAALSRSDAYLTFAVALLAIGTALILMKEFRLVCFDSEFAVVQGWPVSRIDLIMMALVVVVTVIGLQAVGLILIVALLIIPAAAARFWTERLSVMTVLSGLLGGISGYLGSSASALLPRLPAGAVIVLTCGVLFIISFILAPRRGLLIGTFRVMRWRIKISKEHLLRSMYELLEDQDKELGSRKIQLSEIPLIKGWHPILRYFILKRAERDGLVQTALASKALSLTEKGAIEARRLTRNHRLWEEYLFTHAHLAVTHVDRSADIVEHVIDDRILNALEGSLREKGTLPRDLSRPPSIHQLTTNGG